MRFNFRKPNLGNQINWGHPLAKGLVACYLMNEGGGNKIYDLSGNRNTGTFGTHGAAIATWVSGKFGSAINFGGDDYVRRTGFPFILPPFSFSAWVNGPASTSGAYWPIISRGSFDSFNTNFDFGQRTSDPRQLYLYWKNATTTYGTIIASTSLVAGTWVYVAGVVNSSYDVELFVNGKSIGTDSSNSVPTDGSQALNIGYNSGTYAANSLINNVYMWNRALSAAEIQQLYREPFAMFDRPSISLLYVPPAGGLSILDYERSHRGITRGVMVGVT